jgi:hypothetical protein
MRQLGLALVLILALVRPAHADIAGEVYGDVRDVIEELIRSEVTTSVVTAIETRSPALAFYMHGTLERLGSPYWGSLGRVLKQDLTVTVADFVYWHLSSGGGGDVVASAQRFFHCVQDPGKDVACQRLVSSIRDQHRPLLESECRRSKPPPERRVACDVGLATLAALEQRSTVRHHVLDALADVVLYEIDDRGEYDRLADLLTTWLDRPTEVPQSLIETLGNPDLEKQLENGAIDKLCTEDHILGEFLKDPLTDPGWICFATSHSALRPALSATVTIEEGANHVKATIDYWNIEAALKDYDPSTASDDNAFRVLADMIFDARCPAGAAVEGWPCKGPRMQPGATIDVEWLGKTISGTVEKTGLASTKPRNGMMVKLLRFRKAIKRIEELRALVPASLQSHLFFAGTPSSDSRKMLRSVARMARLVGELRARWYLWTQNAGSNPSSASISELDVAELLHVARDIVGKSDALGFLDSSQGGGASKIDIGDWMRLVMRGDYRSLAMESLRAALDLRYDDESRPRETFFLQLSSYLLDAGDGVNETVARSAFKAAAKDLLAATEHVGIPTSAHRWRFRLMPRIALALSFDEDYAATGGDTRRTVVSANWPTAMVAVTDYFGFEGSLIDPIAPLAEMALRPAGDYQDQSYVALDLLRPRLGMWVAVPALSKRLTLSTGFAARFTHLTREANPDPTMVTGRYSARTSLVFDAGLQLVF